MIVGNSEDEAVKDDGDDDGEYYCHPNFHIWPDSVTPGLVLIRVIIHPWICKYRNLFNKHCDDAKEYWEEIDDEYVNVLLHVADLESDTVEPEIPGDGDVEDMVAGTGLGEL